MRTASPFTAVAAVEGWDAWFRWRDAGGLRDRTIEATWWRVARAVAVAEGAQAEAWAARWFEAFAQWRLLPDEGLLRTAGTRMALPVDGVLRATLDAAAFVLPRPARLDLARVADTAALAVRLLDDALLALAPAMRAQAGLRIGVLGVGDALAALGIAYDSDAARALAADLAAAIARGARQGADELAQERGDAARFATLTAIVPQPRLAQLANCASDALDPADPDTCLLAQLKLRLAMQPSIDDPIDYPLPAPRSTAPSDADEMVRFALAHGVAAPVVRAKALATAG